MPKNPAVKNTLKASKLVGKALRVFDQAAFNLEVAASEHLSASDQLRVQADNHREAAFAVEALADVNEDAAYEAQVRADKLRDLLSV